MVQLWVSLRNDKIGKSCVNKRILRIFKNDQVYFYGDYDLDIYIGNRNDYNSLNTVIEKVINRESGWIECVKLDDSTVCEKTNMEHVISEFGRVPMKELKKMFPRKENLKIVQAVELRRDGNFFMYACETMFYYYVFCFATS